MARLPFIAMVPLTSRLLLFSSPPDSTVRVWTFPGHRVEKFGESGKASFGGKRKKIILNEDRSI